LLDKVDKETPLKALVTRQIIQTPHLPPGSFHHLLENFVSAQRLGAKEEKSRLFYMGIYDCLPELIRITESVENSI
jgi:hypothetical protein